MSAKPDTKDESDSSSSWTKIVIFIIVAVLMVAAIVFIVWHFCMRKDKSDDDEESVSKSKSKSKSKKKKNTLKKKNVGQKHRNASVKTKPFAVKRPFAPPNVSVPQSSLVESGSSSTAPPVVGTGSAENSLREDVCYDRSSKRDVQRNKKSWLEQNPEKVTVLCSYGKKGWKAKTEPPKDFSFSIESE